MADSPKQIFDSAHERAESFLKSTEKGPKAKDNLRAAVVFAVAAIDAYFRAKIVKFLKEQRDKNVPKFEMPLTAQKILREAVAKHTLAKVYRDLKKDEKELVDTLVESNKSSLFTYLDKALEYESFQSIEKMSEALKIMGKIPSEIWGRFDASTKSSKKVVKKKGPGRPFKQRVGKKIDAKTQMERMFKKRHQIVHEADVVLRGKKLVGKQRKIEFNSVKKWLEHSRKTIHSIEKLIT